MKLLLISICLLPTIVSSDEITTYFHNDSMNGLKLSDAYETHDMGIRYTAEDWWVDVNLAIVSPDMYTYRNQYRVADRSFGELASVTYGRVYDNYSTYVKFTSIGKFGLDKAQDFAHSVFRLQPVNAINDLVRMPDQYYFGLGIEFNNLYNVPLFEKAEVYFGTDKSFLNISSDKFQIATRDNWALEWHSELAFILHDDVVSAEPIGAKHRSFVPKATVEFSYSLSEQSTIVVTEQVSLPTVSSNSEPFIVFGAAYKYSF